MSARMSVIPDGEHLEHYLEYPRPAHPLVKEVFVKAIVEGAIEHREHGRRSVCSAGPGCRGGGHPRLTPSTNDEPSGAIREA